MQSFIDAQTPEMLLLVQRFLSKLPDCRYQLLAGKLRDVIDADEGVLQLLPKRRLITGESVPNDFASFSFTHSNSSLRYTLKNINRGLLSTRVVNQKHNYRSRLCTGKMAPLPPTMTNKLSNLSKIRHRQISGALGSRMMINHAFWKTFQKQSYVLGHLDQVCLVTLDHNCRNILTGSDEGLIKIWSLSTGLLIMTLRGHSGEVMDMQIHPDNTFLASCDDHKIIRIWDLRNGACVDVLSAHTSKVTTIEWSPAIVTAANGSTVRVLLSTGNDCVVIFWSFNEKDKQFDSGPPIRFCERTKASDKASQQAWTQGGRIVAVGFNDGRIRIYMIHPPWLDKETNPIERIDELQDHTGLIVAIEWSKNPSTSVNPRLLSASFDGTARVWSYFRRSWCSITFNCTIGENCEPYVGDIKKRPKLNDAIWIDNDRLIATAVIGEDIQNVIMIWNSTTGELLHRLKDHREHIRCLKMHPIYNHIFVSTGSDGLVFIWDGKTGEQLREVYFPSTVDTGEPVQIDEAKWTNFGMQLVTADSQGHVGILGFGKNDIYRNIPNELFFESDYHPVITNSDGYVIDEHTGLAPHLTSPGLYTNQHNEPHTNFVYQGHSNMDTIQRDVLGERIRLLAHQLDNSRVEIVPSPASGEDENSMPALPNPQASQAWSQQSLLLSLNNHHIGNHICKLLNKKTIEKRNKQVKQFGIAEQQWYMTERKKAPIKTITHRILSRQQKRKSKFLRVVEESTPEEPIQSDEDHSIQGSDSEWAEPANRPTQTLRTRRPYRHVPSPTYHTQRRTRKKKKRYDSSISAHSTEAFEEDEGSTTNNSEDETEREMTEEEEEEAISGPEALDIDDNVPGPSSGLNESVVTRPRRPKIPSSSDDDDDDLLLPLSKSLNAKNSVTEIDSSMQANASVDTTSQTSFDENQEVSWIKHKQSLRTPFIPQIGDEVYYLPIAHEHYCTDFEAKVDYRLRSNEKVPKEIKCSEELMNTLILCFVESVEVEIIKTAMFKTIPIRCLIIRLKIQEEYEGFSLKRITIRYSPLKDCEEFIIYRELYTCCKTITLRDGDQCSALFENKSDEIEWFDGQVVSVLSDRDYLRYLVLWDSDGEQSYHSTWEVMPRGVHSFTLSDYQQETIPEREFQRLSKIFNSVIKSGHFDAFCDEIEDEFKDKYWGVIPYPTCLSQIKSRLDMQYYRQKEVLLWEVELIHKNCTLFNGDSDSFSNGLYSESLRLTGALAHVINYTGTSYKHFENKIQESLNSSYEKSDSDLEQYTTEISEPSSLSLRRLRRTKVLSDDGDITKRRCTRKTTRYKEFDEYGDTDSDPETQLTPNRNENLHVDPETWKEALRNMLHDLNLSKHEEEKKMNELLCMHKDDAMEHLNRLSATSSRPKRDIRPPKRYFVGYETDDEIEVKENVKPSKRAKRSNSSNHELPKSPTVTKIEPPQRPQRNRKNRVSLEEFEYFDDNAQSPTRPVRQRKRPSRYSEDSEDSSQHWRNGHGYTEVEESEDEEEIVRKSTRTRRQRIIQSENECESSDYEP